MTDKQLQNYLSPSLYRILCLDKNATLDMIKKNYKGMSKTMHPDVSSDPPEIAKENFIKINLAHEVLSKPENRAKYDRFLATYESNIKAQEAKKKAELEKKQKEEKLKKQAEPAKKTTFSNKTTNDWVPPTKDEFKSDVWDAMERILNRFIDQYEELEERKSKIKKV